MQLDGLGVALLKRGQPALQLFHHRGRLSAASLQLLPFPLLLLDVRRQGLQLALERVEARPPFEPDLLAAGGEGGQLDQPRAQTGGVLLRRPQLLRQPLQGLFAGGDGGVGGFQLRLDGFLIPPGLLEAGACLFLLALQSGDVGLNLCPPVPPPRLALLGDAQPVLEVLDLGEGGVPPVLRLGQLVLEGELLLPDAHDFGVQGRQLRLDGDALILDPGRRGLQLLDLLLLTVPVEKAHLRLEEGQLLAELAVPLRLLHLAPEGYELVLQFLEAVGQAQERLLGFGELLLRLGAAFFVPPYSRRLIEELPPLQRLLGENLVHLGLLDDGVGVGPDSGVQEEVVDVLQAAGVAV